MDRHPGHDGRTVADLGGDLDVPTSVPGTRLHLASPWPKVALTLSKWNTAAVIEVAFPKAADALCAGHLLRHIERASVWRRLPVLLADVEQCRAA